MSAEVGKPKLTFAKVAASANAKNLQTPKPKHAAPAASPIAQSVSLNTAQVPEATVAGILSNGLSPSVSTREPEHARNNDPDETFTPRQHNSVPAYQNVPPTPQESDTRVSVGLQTGMTAPVSEENVTKIPSLSTQPGRPGARSIDGRSMISATTFPLDEKESLRPDDSASVQATDEDDSRQSQSQVSSDSGARAFSAQLREIAVREQPTRAANIADRVVVAPPLVRQVPASYAPAPNTAPGQFAGILPGEQDAARPPVVPDEKLLEAMSSVRDRVWVMKLEQDITDFVKDPAAVSFDLPQCNSFYRMLAHKMADYYLLGHTMESSLATIRLWKTPSCRIPPRLSNFVNPTTSESTPPPPLMQMKILRRSDNETRSSSRDGMRDGDSGSEVGKGSFPVTREEREARYEAARLRILGSARPSNDNSDAGVNREHDHSNSNSVVGRKRNQRKQRTDSEDGFEARSAYSMYPQGHMASRGTHQQEQMYNGMPIPSYGPGIAYGMPPPDYGSPGPDEQWYGGGYIPHQPSAQSSGWPMGQPYNLTAQMQAMSMQQQGMLDGYSNGMTGQSVSPHLQYAGPAQYGPGTYGQMPQQWSPPFTSRQSTQWYPYGAMAPPQHQSARPMRANPSHPPPGSYVHQSMQQQQQQQQQHHATQFFNPQSQTFVPGQNDPMASLSSSPRHQNIYHSSPLPARPAPRTISPGMVNGGQVYSPHIPPYQQPPNQRFPGPASSYNHNTHDQQRPSQAQQHDPSQPATRQAPQNHPPKSRQHMTHPLPQPVFPQKSQRHSQHQISQSSKQQNAPLAPAPPDSPATNAGRLRGSSAATLVFGQMPAHVTTCHNNTLNTTGTLTGPSAASSAEHDSKPDMQVGKGALAKYDGKAAGLPAKPPPTEVSLGPTR